MLQGDTSVRMRRRLTVRRADILDSMAARAADRHTIADLATHKVDPGGSRPAPATRPVGGGEVKVRVDVGGGSCGVCGAAGLSAGVSPCPYCGADLG